MTRLMRSKLLEATCYPLFSSCEAFRVYIANCSQLIKVCISFVDDPTRRSLSLQCESVELENQNEIPSSSSRWNCQSKDKF